MLSSLGDELYSDVHCLLTRKCGVEFLEVNTSVSWRQREFHWLVFLGRSHKAADLQLYDLQRRKSKQELTRFFGWTCVCIFRTLGFLILAFSSLIYLSLSGLYSLIRWLCHTRVCRKKCTHVLWRNPDGTGNDACRVFNITSGLKCSYCRFLSFMLGPGSN